MKNKGNRIGLLLILIGLLLIAAALSLAGYNLYDDQRADRSVKDVLMKLESSVHTDAAPDVSSAPPEYDESETAETSSFEPTLSDELVIPDYVLYPKMEMPTKTIDGTKYIGILSIPALGLELPIISEWSYPNLKTAPCRYSGSAYLDDLVICGHDYASHFGHLKQLKEGDLAVFTDMDGNVFIYEMAELEILPPTAIDEMESGGWALTLFTCTVGGQNRLTLRFERLE